MATVCSHQDQSRSRVSSTALLIAFARHLESERSKDDRLFSDPYAKALAGELGKSSISLSGESEEDWGSKKKEAFLKAISTRTRAIDDYVLDTIQRQGIRQVIVLGAGLDTRPWRLDINLPKDDNGGKVNYFEVDFPEVFAYKLSTLQEMGACPNSAINYRNVVADLSLADTWPTLLRDAGFDSACPTLWLMEGFCNYLTESELVKLMSTVFELSAARSRLISTFLTPQSTHVSLKLHRFFPENPLEFMQQFGWQGLQEDIEDLSTHFGRVSVPVDEHRGYFIVKLQK